MSTKWTQAGNIDLTSMRSRLEQQRRQLLADSGHASPGNSGGPLGKLFAGGTDPQIQKTLNALDGAHQRHMAMRKIEAALDRIKRGHFGICIGCGRPIPVELLDQDPATPHCQGCYQQKDQKPREPSKDS